MTILDKNFRQ